MTRRAEAALRFRDAVALALMATLGPVGAILAVGVLVMRGSFGMPPDPEYLAAAFLAVIVGMLMIWARWLLRSGRSATFTLGMLGAIHALAGAVFLRTAIDGAESLAPAVLSGYALLMSILLASCVRVPIRIPEKSDN